jgi:peptide chain release factor 3
MDPNHRDQAAFIRVCSGRFERTMELRNLRSGKLIRAARAHRLFAGEREGLEHAYPGDVVALISRGKFAIGDVLVPEGFSGSEPDFGGFPRFQPEHFAVLHNQDVSKHKQFDKGLRQLESEGAVQVLHSQRHGPREPILAAVGELQFDVVQARLLAEYQTATSTTRLDYAHARWLPDTDNPKEELRLPGSGTLPATDEEGRTILLLKSDWTLRFCEENNPSVDFRTLDERAS